MKCPKCTCTMERVKQASSPVVTRWRCPWCRYTCEAQQPNKIFPEVA